MVREALTQAGPDQIEGVVTGWVVVSEWVDRDGMTWLSRLDGDAGDEPITAWRRQGFLHNALHEPWLEDEDEE